jgi:hypothetical protein
VKDQQHKAMHLMVLGTISQLDEPTQKSIHEAADALRKIVNDAGDAGFIALTLVGLEFSEEAP